jgi:hypothetical protein
MEAYFNLNGFFPFYCVILKFCDNVLVAYLHDDAFLEHCTLYGYN